TLTRNLLWTSKKTKLFGRGIMYGLLAGRRREGEESEKWRESKEIFGAKLRPRAMRAMNRHTTMTGAQHHLEPARAGKRQKEALVTANPVATASSCGEAFFLPIFWMRPRPHPFSRPPTCYGPP